MHVIILKYVQVLCITVFFSNNVNCDQLLLQNERKDLQLHYLAACTANCLRNAIKANLELCYAYCSDNSQETLTLKLIEENSTIITLVCRDSTSLILNITNSFVEKDFTRVENTRIPTAAESIDGHSSNSTASNQTDVRFVYLIKIQEGNNELAARIIYMSNTSIIKIDNLTSNTYYNITATIINSNNEYINTSRMEQFKTLTWNYKPGDIIDIEVAQFTSNSIDKRYVDAFITWKPSKDMTCHYEIICYSPDMGEFQYPSKPVWKPEELYNYKLEKLSFGTNFDLGVRGKNTRDMSLESDIIWKTLSTPSCLQWHKSLDICEPEMPGNVTITATNVGTNKYDLNISWMQPEYEPNHYEIKMFDLNPLMYDTPNSMQVNVSGNATEVFLESVTINGFQYEILVTSIAAGGASTSLSTKSIEGHYFVVEDKWKTLKVSVAIVTPIMGITIFALLILLLFHRRAKQQRYEERCQYFTDLEQKAPVDPNSNFDLKTKHIITLNTLQLEFDNTYLMNDPMEIKREYIKILDGNIGEGAFGLVRKGLLKCEGGETKVVAVKMLKDCPCIEDIKEFRREIEVMKSVGIHPNIVGIVGHCIKNLDEMMLLTEYCSNGNLLNFLRFEWQKILEKHRKHSERDCLTPRFPNNKSPENVFNFDTSFVNEKRSLTYKNIVTHNHQHQAQHSPDTNLSNIINKSNIENSENVLKSIVLETTTSDKNNNDNCDGGTVGDSGSVGGGNTNNLIINKLYDEYNGLCESQLNCTNACKCRVEVIKNENVNNNRLAVSSDSILHKCIIKINECNCNLNSTRRSNAIVKSASFTLNYPRGSLGGVSSDGTIVDVIGVGRMLEEPPSGSGVNSIESTGDYDGIIPTNERTLKMVENRCYTQMDQSEHSYLTTRDLILFAKQVALGMEYLARNKVIHRDLAARNVLVCEDRSIKIADFGLSRDIYQENIYKKTGNGKLPIKWLALESMTHQVYTTQSDVWSYGILLYEIITLGGNPYPSIATSRLLHLLKSGYRMERPRNCSQEIYDLMYSCWKSNPSERPTFTQICERLDQIHSNMTDNNSLDINVNDDNQSNKTSSNESYLKPI